MKTARYIVCGAMTVYALVAPTVWLLLVGWTAVVALLVASIYGGYFGYRHAKRKQRTAANAAWAPTRAASASQSLAHENLA
jgi:hypothetical protein